MPVTFYWISHWLVRSEENGGLTLTTNGTWFTGNMINEVKSCLQSNRDQQVLRDRPIQFTPNTIPQVTFISRVEDACSPLHAQREFGVRNCRRG